jgi:histidinol dehydrogenase
MKIVDARGFVSIEQVKRLAREIRLRALIYQKNLEDKVKKIIEEVVKNGDEAIIRFTYEFDGVKLNYDDLLVSEDEIKEAFNKVSSDEIKALELLVERVSKVEKERLKRIKFSYEDEFVSIQVKPEPIDSVACYVPYGNACYPSSLIMGIVPAKVAGVSRLVVSTPPMKNRKVNPLTLVAAKVCNVNEVYKIGGAQAIAALAYGTKRVKKVSKIVGPGGVFVSLAKKIVSNDVAIDFFAGPSEIMIYSNNDLNARLIALDLIAQAEHGKDTICGFLTCSKPLAEEVYKEVNGLIEVIDKRNIIKKNMQNYFIIVFGDEKFAIEFINEFAPEHIEVYDEEVAKKISSAGLILVGKYATVALSDYILGTNHILPTSSYAKVRSGLNCLDFVKLITIAKCNKKGFKSLAKYAIKLAKSEGLKNHAVSLEERLKELG